MIKSSYLTYFLSLIKTKRHADEVVAKLDLLKENLYNKKISLDKKIDELFSYEMKEKLMAYIWQEQINMNDPELFGKFLSEIRTYVKNMPVVKVCIAFNPDEGLISDICAWFVERYGRYVLTDVTVDKSLIAGAIITFNDKSVDFSVKKKMEIKYGSEEWRNLTEKIRKVSATKEETSFLVTPTNFPLSSDPVSQTALTA